MHKTKNRKEVKEMKKLLILLAIVPFMCAFSYESFTELTNKEPNHTAYHEQNDIYWQIFDLDEDGNPDAAMGYKPNGAVPVFMMTPVGMMLMWQVDIDGVSATYYWKDLDGNGLPFQDEGYDTAEILHDPNGDGLNGNEEVAYKLGKKVST